MTFEPIESTFAPGVGTADKRGAVTLISPSVDEFGRTALARHAR